MIRVLGVSVFATCQDWDTMAETKAEAARLQDEQLRVLGGAMFAE